MANTAEIKTAPKLTEVARAPELKRSAQDAAEVGTARVRALVEEGAAGAQKLMEKNVDQANKAAEGLFRAAEGAAEFGRGNVEAFAKATQVYVAGVQDLGRQTMALVQGLTDHALEGAKALSAVKSLQEAAQIQASYTRAAIEKTVSDGAKLQESAIRLAEHAFAPISARMTVGLERFGRTTTAA